MGPRSRSDGEELGKTDGRMEDMSMPWLVICIGNPREKSRPILDHFSR